MHQRSSLLLTLAVGLALALAGCADTGNTPADAASEGTLAPLYRADAAQDRVPDTYIVVLNESVRDVPAVASEMARAHGLTRGHVYSNSIKGYSAVIPAARLDAVRSDPRVAYIEPDRIVAFAPPPGKGPGGGGPAPQETPWGITRVGGTGNGVGKVAWVIDSGIDLENADLNVDVARSRDFTGSRKGAQDENGHGTHVAGTIAAIDNSIDVVGVAAGATVVAVRVLDRRGSGSYSGVIAGVDYVAGAGQSGDVANMSLGGPGSQALDDAVVAASARVKFALAAGNDGSHANGYSPARANGTNIFTVSAINSSDVFASFSNYGNPPVDYAAPGVGVSSLKVGGGTVTYNGTSMAAPHVAGILLLGPIRTSGTAINDPDTTPDPIAHR